MYRLTVLEAESSKSRYCQGQFLPRGVRENLLHACPLASGSLRHSLTCRWRPPCVFGSLPSVHVCLQVQTSSLYKYISRIGLEPILVTSFNTITSVKTLSPNKITTRGPGELGLQYICSGGHDSTHNTEYPK